MVETAGMLVAWLHDLDPFLVQFPEGFFVDGIRWYGMAYISTFVLGWVFTRLIIRAGRTTLGKQEAFDFVVVAALGVVAGGRLGYVLFYKPALFVTFESSLPWWGVLQMNEGGMSSHGGMIGVAAAVWWFARRRRGGKQIGDEVKPAHEAKPVKHRFLHLFDIAAITAAMGFFLGRIANFINAELIGRVCDPDLLWAVKYPQEMREWSTNELMRLTPVVDHVGVEKTEWVTALADIGDEQNQQLVRATIERLIVAIQDGGQAGQATAEIIAPHLTTHHPSQLYAAFLEGLLVFVVLAIIWRQARRPGVIAGLYGVLYGAMRIVNEFWRAPDAHIADEEFAAIGLTRGQLLSIVMVVIGAIVTVWASRRNVEKIGGWMKED